MPLVNFITVFFKTNIIIVLFRSFSFRVLEDYRIAKTHNKNH